MPARFFWQGQLVHSLALAALLVGAFLLVRLEDLDDELVLGIKPQGWFMVALIVPICHQGYVWLSWRSELCFGTLTNWLGPKAFIIYQIVFMVFLLGRPVSLGLLAGADHDSLALSMSTRSILCLMLGLPACFTFYSVARYFGFARAAGIDHFDESYRRKPLVSQGIFKFTSNAMYWYGFLLLWAIAIAAASWAAVVVSLFSHLYIWVHYWCTERPDMKAIYGSYDLPE